MGQHKIIAHRGMSTLAPENTMAAFELMPRYNVNWLETDLAITSDEKLVIMHDGDVSRTTNGHRRVTALNFEELHRLSAGAWFDSKFRNQADQRQGCRSINPFNGAAVSKPNRSHRFANSGGHFLILSKYFNEDETDTTGFRICVPV